MTPRELRALAIYRTHKHCHCADCQVARAALYEYDRQPRVSGIGRRIIPGMIPGPIRIQAPS